jgi:hypothetical protein
MPERSLATLTELFEEARFSPHPIPIPIPISASARARSELQTASETLSVLRAPRLLTPTTRADDE